MTSPRIRPAEIDDFAAIKAIAVAAGMFDLDEVEFFDEMFAGWLDGSLEGHEWIVATDGTGADEEPVIAAANYAPEPFSDRMWNLYFIAVNPPQQHDGVGGELMARAESDLRAKGEGEARVLIVETSSTDQYALARDFYAKLGYAEEARIREFYGPDDHKVVFWKSLTD